MTMRNLLAGAGFAAALLTAGTAAIAGPEIPLGGYTGPVQLKFFNYESFLTPGGTIDTTPAPGDQNFGIFEVTSIQGGPNTLFASGLSGSPYLVGVFNGIQVTSVTATTATNERTTNTGGTFQLYMVPNADGFHDLGTAGYAAAAGCTLGGLCYHGITDAAGSQLVLTMNLTPGQGGALDPLSTLIANLDTTQNPPTGSAASHATITGDPQFGSVATLADDFCPNVSGSTCGAGDGSTFTFASSDPIAGTVVPEPASMAIIGSGLVALGALRRRKKAASSV